MLQNQKSEALSIVALGVFNPAIVTPAWLELHELVPEGSAETADVEVTHKELSAFSIRGIRIQTLRERLLVASESSREQETMCDLAKGLLEILEHTPVTHVGMNYETAFALSSETAWHQKGDLLAPKDPWKQLLTSPRLAGLSMRDSRGDGYRDVHVGPVDTLPFGLAVRVNDHYVVSSASTAALVLEGWASSLAEARRIAEALAKESS